MTHRRTRVTAVVAALALMVVAGCAPGPSPVPTESVAAFALTAADVAVPEDQDFDVSFPFVADPDDPIWTELERVAVPQGPNFAAETMDLKRQDGPGGQQLGTITLRMPMDSLPLSFTQVEVQFKGDDTMRSFDVGRWNLAVASSNPQVPEVGATGLSGAIPCGSTSGTFRNDTGETLVSTSARVAADGVEVTSSMEPPRVFPRQNFELTLDLSCDTSSDFYIVSPDVVFETEGAPVSTRLGWISMGYMDVDDAALERIHQR